uniref:Uncharacterized protein n=1 Tax=Arundo donax TaxID=35708 RepID=A0A0A9FV95_ARUDO
MHFSITLEMTLLVISVITAEPITPAFTQATYTDSLSSSPREGEELRWIYSHQMFFAESSLRNLTEL